MKITTPFLMVFICLWLSGQNATTQQTAKSQESEKSQNAKPGFKIFFEKVYLHLDRSVYASGEDIWFKAYLVNASNWLTGTSSNLYVELISPDSKMMDRKVIRLNNGTGAGDFNLGDSVPEGKYRIRAYTNWMRNFKDCFIFEKEVVVHNSLGLKSGIKFQVPDDNKADIRFFPEGGSLVAGVTSIVGFKAIDGAGKGCDVKGKIISSTGDTLGWFESSHLGMGKFSFLPVQGTSYYATGMLKNRIPFKTELPVALAKGFVMRINNNDTAGMIVSLLTNTETFSEFKDKELVLAGQTNGKSYFTAKIKVSGPQLSVRVPKSLFPAGIACITLYDVNLKPCCERLAFIDRKNNITLSVTPDKKSYKPREEVALSVKTLDSHKLPVKADLSLAVVDGNMVPGDYSSIVSYFMLESEIKGEIEKPAMYFDTTNVNRFKELDLLLLSQGWRNFVWRQLADSGVRIRYMLEPGITISGKVREKFVNRPQAGVPVTLMIRGSKKGLLFTETDSTGRYYIDGVEFYGKKTLTLTTTNKKGKGKGWILRDSLLFNKPIEVPFRPAYEPDKQVLGQFSEEADSRHKEMKKYSLSDTISLSEVVIASKNQRSQQQKQAAFMESGIIDYDFKISPDDYSFMDIGAYLLDKVPGAMLASSAGGTDSSNSPTEVAFRNMGDVLKPRFVLDQLTISDQENFVIYNLSMEQIERILISKGDNMASDAASRNRYVISIFTKPGSLDKKNFNTLSEEATGYYEAREFYSPRYSSPKKEGERPDVRTTIYWNNHMQTDENGNAVVRFNNADKTGLIRTVTEGMTEKGVPVAGYTSYQIK